MGPNSLYKAQWVKIIKKYHFSNKIRGKFKIVTETPSTHVLRQFPQVFKMRQFRDILNQYGKLGQFLKLHLNCMLIQGVIIIFYYQALALQEVAA